MVISCGDGTVDLEVAEHPRLGAVGLRWDDGANAALLEVVADRIGIIGLVGDEGSDKSISVS